MDEVVRDELGSEQAPQPEAQPEPNAATSPPDPAQAAGLAESVTEKNTFLDCRSPWLEHVDLPQRPSSWPPYRPSSYPEGCQRCSRGAAEVPEVSEEPEVAASQNSQKSHKGKEKEKGKSDTMKHRLLKKLFAPELEFGWHKVVESEINITVDRRAGQTLGIQWKEDHSGFLAITECKQTTGGLVQRWNNENPMRAVKAGDRIVEVNGIRSDAHQLDNEVNQQKILELRVERVQRVKMYVVAFDVIAGSTLDGKQLKNLNVEFPCLRCLRILKIKAKKPSNRQHIPDADSIIRAGWRIFAMFERPGSSNVVQVPSVGDVNAHLKEQSIGGLFDFDERRDKLQLVSSPDEWWSEIAVKHLRLDLPAAKLKLERFDCLQVSYPQGADAGWIAAPIDVWKHGSKHRSSHAGFPSSRNITKALVDVPWKLRWTLRALSWRYNFEFMVVSVLSKKTVDRGTALMKYVTPPLPTTIIQSGDKILFLPTTDVDSPSQCDFDEVLRTDDMQCIVTQLCNKNFINSLDHHAPCCLNCASRRSTSS